MIKKVLAAIAALIVVLVVVVATRPSAYHVERKLEIAAPPERVFAVLNDLRQFVGVLVVFGSPFEKIDPNMHKTIEGPASGVGQSYAWSGTSDVGKGKVTIEESVPSSKVGMKLNFEEPMQSTSTYALTVAPMATGSLVTWTWDGNHNFIGKAFGLFADVDGMLGDDVEKSLAQLKSISEAKGL